MEMKKLFGRKLVTGFIITAATAAPAAFAAEGAPDFSTILGGFAVTSIVAAVMSAGGLKAVANFTKWGANKLAGFFR